MTDRVELMEFYPCKWQNCNVGHIGVKANLFESISKLHAVIHGIHMMNVNHSLGFPPVSP